MATIEQILESLKGITGTANVLAKATEKLGEAPHMMDPGDYVRKNPSKTMAAPVATDLWYLWTNVNMMAAYYPDLSANDQKYYDYTAYINENLSFLSLLPGLKPIKTVKDLKAQLSVDTYFDAYSMTIKNDWTNKGIYWINTLAFEFWTKKQGVQYPSVGSPNYKINPNDYVGYITFPIGQLGAQEVISLLQETELMGYQFAAVDSLSNYYTKKAVTLQDRDKPATQTTPALFPDMKDSNGNALVGKNYCYGRHLVENAYRIPTESLPGQNTDSPAGETYSQPVRDVELFSSDIKDYGENVKPKLWLRYWIHKDSTLPVPGEFIGILCRPVATPPHVWWFQESSPFLYAGNWMETSNLTSGIVTTVLSNNQYKVKVQGCEVILTSSDFFTYSAGDRVAILKIDSTAVLSTKSFRWLDQDPFINTEKGTEITDYVVIPFTFYKKMN